MTEAKHLKTVRKKRGYSMKNPNIIPGPWAYGENSLDGYTIKRGLYHIASTSTDAPMRERSKEEANAKAIAAVPDVLHALHGIYLSMKAHPDYQTGRNQEFIDHVEIAESALRKAGYET